MEVCSELDGVLTSIRKPDARRLVTSELYGSTLALTEMAAPANHGATSPLAYDEAYLIQFRLQDCPRCDYFLDGRHNPQSDYRAGLFQVLDLRRAPMVDVRDPFHLMHLLLPRQALEEISYDACKCSISELNFRPTEGIRDAVLENLYTSLRPALGDPKYANRLFVDHTVIAICAHIAHVYGEGNCAQRDTVGGLAPWQERRAKALLISDLTGNIPLAVLAKECGLSVRHFSRAFSKTVGIPPHRYLVGQRLERARDLLSNSILSLPEIALACGFVDQSHFTKMFRSAVGVTPRIWRKIRHPATKYENPPHS